MLVAAGHSFLQSDELQRVCKSIEELFLIDLKCPQNNSSHCKTPTIDGMKGTKYLHGQLVTPFQTPLVFL